MSEYSSEPPASIKDNKEIKTLQERAATKGVQVSFASDGRYIKLHESKLKVTKHHFVERYKYIVDTKAYDNKVPLSVTATWDFGEYEYVVKFTK